MFSDRSCRLSTTEVDFCSKKMEFLRANPTPAAGSASGTPAAVVREIASCLNFVALPASCWNACLNRVRSFSPWTILRFLGVWPRCDRPAQLAGCASSYPMPRVELSSRGGERHILCRRSVPHAPDLYRDTVARFQTPSRVHRSISRTFQWKSIAAPVSRL